MNFFTGFTICLILLSFCLFVISFFTRMKPYGKRTRLLFYCSAGAALLVFIAWGISRNF